MSVAFWSVTVTNKTPVEVQPPEGFVLNLQQAALVGASKGSAVLKVSTVAIEGDAIEAVIGTLRPVTADQINFSLVFGYDVPATFSLSGDANGTVHLSGYYQPGPDDDEEGDSYDGEDGEFGGESDDEDDEDSGDEEDVAGAKLALAAINKMKNASGKPIENSKGKVVQLPSESEEGSSSEEEGDDEEDDAFVKKMISKTQGTKENLNKKMNQPPTPAAKKSGTPAPQDSDDSEDEEDDSQDGSDDDDEDDSEDGSEDGSEEDDSESEEEPPVKVQKTVAKGIVTPAGSHNNNKPQQQQQQQNKPNGNNNNSKPNTPSKPAFGSGSNNNNNNKQNNNQGNKTPQGGNFKQQMQHSGNKNNNHQSGDKRKR